MKILFQILTRATIIGEAGEVPAEAVRDLYLSRYENAKYWESYTDFAYFRRAHESTLESNELALPLFAEQNRQHTRHGLLGSVTHERGGHNLKAGVDFQRVSPREFFTFYVTDEDEAREREISDEVIAFDKDDPFVFRDRTVRNQYSGTPAISTNVRSFKDYSLNGVFLLAKQNGTPSGTWFSSHLRYA